MSHKASPRRTGKMRKQIVRWSYAKVFKVAKGGKIKEEVAVHTPPAW